MTKQISCPECGGPSLYSPENAFRPFCSERCQLIDLGGWADNKYGVPGESIKTETSSQSTDSNEKDDTREPQQDE